MVSNTIVAGIFFFLTKVERDHSLSVVTLNRQQQEVERSKARPNWNFPAVTYS